ncbi:MAG: ribose-phosphate pyrophosphokinase [Oscillospiraceae bacterium]|jgi:ribose-phosphate pyrophosphokinase|nr:ribose-phosphate pyrophosphokinase [Oscillospiraceae bacterium]
MECEKRPYGPLGLICMKGSEELAAQIDGTLKARNVETGGAGQSVLVEYDCPRFSTGEAKGMILQTVRGYDLYILADVFNYSVTYKMFGMDVPMGPDNHFQDLKRVIGATNGKARRITLIMPLLYEGRQDRRSARESLDCALMLQELVRMGVSNIITFDAHDVRVQNAIPLSGFENIRPSYQMVHTLLETNKDLKVDADHMMIVSPDEGGMTRSIFYASVMGIDLGMCYKRRDYSLVVDGRNPILSHEFLGGNLEGRDVILVDDIIASGESILNVAENLKERGAGRIFIFVTFGQFTGGLSAYDKAYAGGLFHRVYTTNLIYQTGELLSRPWYCSVDMSKYLAHIIDTLNVDSSISDLLDPSARIQNLLAAHRNGEI